MKKLLASLLILLGLGAAALAQSGGITGNCVLVTGTGGCVGQTSPTLITPVLGVATGTSVALGGATIGTDALAVTGSATIGGTTISSSGSITVPSGQSISAPTVSAGVSGFLRWASRTLLSAPADGAVSIQNNSQTVTSTISVPVSASLQFGAADVDTAPVAQTVRTQGALAGGTSNVLGANWTFIASPGKGSSCGGSFIFQTTPAGSSGTVVGTPTTALTLDCTQKATFGGQIVAASMTQTSAAQSGTVCWAAAGLTYDASLGCLASLEELKNIRAGGIPEALADIRRLKPFWFNWKSTTPEWKGGNHEVLPGLGAHATEAVDKRLVGYGPDGKLRGVHYPEMVALLVAGMQQQQKQIDGLTRRVAVLERRR